MAKKQRYPIMAALKGKIREENQSYRTLSVETGISVDAINNKLNGFSAMNYDDVELIARALNIPPNDILRYFFLICCETQQMNRHRRARFEQTNVRKNFSVTIETEKGDPVLDRIADTP